MVGELLAAGLEAILEEFHIATTAVAALLVFDFVLYNKGFVGKSDGRREGGRDSVVGCLALRDETLVAVNDRDGRIFDIPFADIAEGLTPDGCLLRGLGGCPSVSPVVSELLNERSLDLGGLWTRGQ